MLIEFTDKKERGVWKPINDAVMGGMSQGQLKLSDAANGLFCGHLSLENNGGFTLIRRCVEVDDFKNSTGVLLKIKGDGRNYQFRVKTDHQQNSIAYRIVFETDAQQWQAIHLPFYQFIANVRGKIIPDAAELQPEKIKQIGFLLADKQQGEFCLEIAWIKSI